MPEIPPSLLKIPQAGHDLPAPPPSPPPPAPPTEQGEGVESQPGPPVHLEQVLLLSLDVCILLQNIIYTHSILSGWDKYTNILL
jgi:hypothetical protein